MPTCIVTGTRTEIQLDTHELAWAAGFFDGEGCVSTWKQDKCNPRLIVTISQKDKRVLLRFRKAVLGKGTILKHSITYSGTRYWRLNINNFEHTQMVMAMLWKYLSPVKRQQFRDAVSKYHTTHMGNLRIGWSATRNKTSPATVNAVSSMSTLIQ